MQIAKRFLKAHREAITKTWPFRFSYLGGKRSATAGQGKRLDQRGQVVVEFILLIVISVTAATYISKKIVSRDPEEPGFLTGAWSQMNTVIGSDLID